MPVPVNETEDDADVPLPVTVSEPLRMPVAVGMNVTLMVHEAFTANDDPQLLTWLKSPEALIWAIVKLPSPVLVSVTAWVALVVPTIWPANVSDDGDKLATGMVPVPERLMLGAVPVKFPCAVMVPLREPSAVGVNVAVTIQVALGAKDAGQLLVWAKSPVTVNPVRFRTVFPLFKKNTDLAVLVDPSAWLPKESVAGLNRPRVAVPLPVNDTDAGEPGKLPWMVNVALRIPVPWGAKVTLKVHVAPAAIVNGQLLTTL